MPFDPFKRLARARLTSDLPLTALWRRAGLLDCAVTTPAFVAARESLPDYRGKGQYPAISVATKLRLFPVAFCAAMFSTTGSGGSGQPSPPKQSQGAGSTRFVAWTPAFALAAVVVYAISGHDMESAGSVLAVGVGVMGAALAAGLLFGFLFGLPKTIDRQNDKALLATNTNLDQISDWLTKILVGIGLVQLNRIAHSVSSLAHSIAPGLGSGPGAVPFAVALLVYSTVVGFMIGYLWTRIDLSTRFRRAVQELDREEIEQALGRSVSPPLRPPDGG